MPAIIPTVTLNDGTVMPQLGLGVWKAEDGDEVAGAVKAAIDNGYRLIDTAAIYNNESGVGEGIRSSGVAREDLFITTKLWNSDQGKDSVFPAFETSLKKIGLEYVDLYLIHWPMPEVGLFIESWKELEKIHQSGRAKSIGVCNFPVEQMQQLLDAATIKPVLNQIELHPRLPQHELRDFCKQHDIYIESWSPIGGSKSDLLEDSTLATIASAHDKTAAQIVIRWHVQNGLIVIPKSVKEHRIIENADVFDFELSSEEMEQINNLENGQRQGPDPSEMNAR